MTEHPIVLHKPRLAAWLMDPIRASRGLYLQVALAATLVNLFSLATSLFSMTVYNRIVPNNATDSLIALSVGMGIVLVFDFVLRSLRGYFVDIAGRRIDATVGTAIFDRMLSMRMESRKGSNGAFAGLLREFESLRDFFASATLVAIVDVPFILLFLTVIWAIGGWVVIVPLALVPAVIGVGLFSQPSLGELAGKGLTQGMSKQGVLVETISGLETIKSSSAGPLMARRWAQAVEDHAASSLKQRLVAAVTINVAQSAQQVCYIGVVILGVYLVADHQLTMGGLIAASILGSRCVAPLGQIASLLTRISHTRSAYAHIDQLMQSGGEARDDTRYLRRPKLDGTIEFRNVIFRYPGSTVRALDDVSFLIEPGEHVAIVGRVGSGKSTIARLILGLYEPSEGAVLVDDADVRQLHPEDLRRNIGAVLQDVFLLTGSVRENIALGNSAVDDAAVLRAARVSGTHDFIGQMPNGYDLKLADRGEGLSGGQRQSIAMARALASDHPILLFDEPTSAMDIQSENALIARLETELQRKTVVLVTHRQSMLRLADRVIIMDHGKIVAAGPRDDVLKSVAVN
ncbi:MULTISPECIES: type I secretion system permease/ATPase [unclassified Sphingomonas]|uniref:type I secretion system permease/ATPase n=1 Tax=unclassified Sphingomonas TaxID=196159 RepID=UPI001F596EF8|nr:MULTISPECIES: type I secretion system permease/ATPase [unclassified Sphingomonas]